MYVNQLCADLIGTRGSYTVKIQAQAEKTFDDTTAIYEVRIDDENQEVILFPVVTLKQASAEMDKARMDVLSEYITEIKRLELEITRLKAELEKAWKDANVSDHLYQKALVTMERIRKETKEEIDVMQKSRAYWRDSYFLLAEGSE